MHRNEHEPETQMTETTSPTGLTVEQVHRLRDEFSIYTVDSSRVNVASFNDRNTGHFIRGLTTVLDE